jgi:hypothetical protein
MRPTALKAVQAYGGQDRWAAAKVLEAEFSADGLAFRLKRRPPFKRARIVMDTQRPYARITPIGRNPEIAGVWDGVDVRLEHADGRVLAQRPDARRRFPYGRRLFYWDDLDMAYFANYAMWNYLTLPVLLMRRSIIWQEIDAGLLEAHFPASIPTHNTFQRFRFDPDTGLLRQHDYTAEVIGRFAKAANVVLAHTAFNGLRFTSHRLITPRNAQGRPMRGPVLIEIRVHTVNLIDN